MVNTKVTKTFRFESKVIDHSSTNPVISSFAEWCCQRYKEEFMSVENISKRIEEQENNLNSLKDQLKVLQQKSQETSILNSYELAWIKSEAKRRIKGSTFEGVYKFFIHKYDRNDINRKQFKLLVEKYG